MVPVFSVKASVLDGLADVLRGDLSAFVEIGDRPAHLQDAVVRAGGKAHPVERPAQKLLRLRRQRADFAQEIAGKLRIARNAQSLIAPRLYLAGLLHAERDLGGGLSLFIRGKFVVFLFLP